MPPESRTRHFMRLRIADLGLRIGWEWGVGIGDWGMRIGECGMDGEDEDEEDEEDEEEEV
jgi:hypothetical protein